MEVDYPQEDMTMIYAEKDMQGKLTGDVVIRDIPPIRYFAWTEYATIEEFEADLEVDRQVRCDNLHQEA